MRNSLKLIFILSMCVLVGCSKNEGDINYITNNNREHITKEIVNAEENVIVKIDADIIYPTTKDIPVVTTKKYEFTNDDIKKLANIFYGNSEYYKLLDPSEYSVSQLNDAIKEYELDIEDIEQLYSDNKIDVNTYTSYLLTCNIELATLNQRLKSAPTEVDNSPILEFYELTTDYYDFSFDEENEIKELTDTYTYTITTCKLQGTYNTMPCKIDFWNKSDLYIEMDASDALVWKNYTYKEIDFNYDAADSYNSVDTSIENQCVYSTEQAINMCNDIIKELGISNMEVMDIRHLSINAYQTSSRGYHYEYPIENGYCGYEVYYGKSINNVNTNMSIDGGTLYTATIRKMSEGLYFTIMDCGIISVTYYYPTIIQDISSTNTTILDFDTIISLSDIYLPNAYEEYGKKPFNITRIQLGFMEIPSTSNNSDATLIPVWDFYEDDSYISVLTINAIDGNIINRVTCAVVE